MAKCFKCDFPSEIGSNVVSYRCNRCSNINCLNCQSIHEAACKKAQSIKLRATRSKSQTISTSQKKLSLDVPRKTQKRRATMLPFPSLSASIGKVYCDVCLQYYKQLKPHLETNKHLKNLKSKRMKLEADAFVSDDDDDADTIINGEC